MALGQSAGLLCWYTSSVVLAILTFINIVSKLYRHVARPTRSSSGSDESARKLEPRPSPTTSTSSEQSVIKLDTESQTTKCRPLGLRCRLCRAAFTAGEKYLYLTGLPLPKIPFWTRVVVSKSVPTSEVIWNGGYTAAVLLLSFYGTSWDVQVWCNQTAWVATAQIPLIVALAGKNNIVALLTGIPYEKLNFVHRAAGRLFLLCLWLHAIGNWYIVGGWTDADWHRKMPQWGTTGLGAITLLYLTALPWVRRKLYEFFLVAHICLAAVGLAATIMHWSATAVWVYPGVGIWVADRLLRVLRLFFLNRLWVSMPRPTAHSILATATAKNLPSIATLTLLTPSTLRVAFPQPSCLSWRAGQHFYVVMPGMSRLPWEAHPFTAATIPENGGELAFIVRVRDGFTKEMKNRVDEERKAQGLGIEEQCSIEVKAAVDGPYGRGGDKRRFDAVLIFAGGSGISFAISHLAQIIQEAREGKTNVRAVRIVWMVKSRLHLNWIAPLLLSHVSSIPPSLQVTLNIHVTKHYFPRGEFAGLPGQSALPMNPEEAGTSDWRAYLERRAAEPRRDSRRGSTMSWATFTDPQDRDDLAGPGTRRGSIAVLPGEAKKLTPAKKLPRASQEEDKSAKKVSLESVVVPVFTWTQGYGENEQPYDYDGSSKSRQSSGNSKIWAIDELGTQAESEPSEPGSPPANLTQLDDDLILPLTPARYSQGLHEPSSPTLSPLGTFRGRPSSAPPLDDSPLHSLRRKQSLDLFARAESPFSPLRDRQSLYLAPDAPSPPASPGIPPAAASLSRPLTGDLTRPLLTPHQLPKLRQMSITIDEPDHPRRKSSAHSSGSSNPPSRKQSLLAPQPKRLQSALSIAIEPENTSFLYPPGPSLMVKSPSAQSDLSIKSILSVQSLPPLASGALTPAVAERESGLPTTFADESTERRDQSLGLEHIVHWHEGRANLDFVVQEMMDQVALLRGDGDLAEEGRVGSGGLLSVNACGPRSLLDSARRVCRSVTSVEGAWNGEVVVEFHAETFGW